MARLEQLNREKYDRTKSPLFGIRSKRRLAVVLGWTKSDVWRFVLDHKIPYNPLHDRGYPSIGCWPCTRPVQPGEDDRAGRWAGKVKKECGLHVIEVSGGEGI